MQPILEVKNIKKAFGDHEVLKGIDFTMNKGEVLVIIGSSGSGKTTLLRCLNFLETADTGEIYVNGEKIFDGASNKKEKYNDLRRKRLHFGLVFQNFNLFPHMNVSRNVRIAAELLEKEKIKAECKRLRAEGVKGKALAHKKRELNREGFARIVELADKTLDRVGLLNAKDSYPCILSGGMQQRVAIARALVLSPDILCFDEPTSALDPELTGEVLKVIKGLKGKDCTMIIVTHEMDFAYKVADKIIFMSKGVIEEMGTPTEVFDNPKSEVTKAFLQKSQDTGY